MNIDIHEQKMKRTFASLYRPIIHIFRKNLVTGSKQCLPSYTKLQVSKGQVHACDDGDKKNSQ